MAISVVSMSINLSHINPVLPSLGGFCMGDLGSKLGAMVLGALTVLVVAGMGNDATATLGILTVVLYAVGSVVSNA